MPDRAESVDLREGTALESRPLGPQRTLHNLATDLVRITQGDGSTPVTRLIRLDEYDRGHPSALDVPDVEHSCHPPEADSLPGVVNQ